MNKKEVDNNRNITIYGVTFHGINDLKEHALHKPKEGVYVGEDSLHYPCFDSFDSAYDNRRYWNFVFAKSEEELRKKLEILKNISGEVNYYKLSLHIAEEIGPMIYFGGSNDMPMVVTECEDLIIPEKIVRKKTKKAKQCSPTGKTKMELLMEKLKKQHLAYLNSLRM